MTWDDASAGTITLEPERAGWVARLTGEIDAAVVRSFSDDGPAQHSSEHAVVTAVDAAQVTFLDSSGLALLLRWATRAREAGRITELRAPSVVVQDLVRISGTSSLFSPAS